MLRRREGYRSKVHRMRNLPDTHYVPIGPFKNFLRPPELRSTPKNSLFQPFLTKFSAKISFFATSQTQKTQCLAFAALKKKRLTHRTHFLFAPGHSPDLLEFPRKYLGRVESRKIFSRPWIPKRRKAKKHFFRTNRWFVRVFSRNPPPQKSWKMVFLTLNWNKKGFRGRVTTGVSEL